MPIRKLEEDTLGKAVGKDNFMDGRCMELVQELLSSRALLLA